MTTAALALALALLVAPGPRRRLVLRHPRAGLPRGVAYSVPVLLVSALILTVPAPVVVAGGLVAATVAARYRRRRRLRRRHEESAALQSALDVLVGELRVGAHPVSAFDVAAGETGGTVAAALRAVAARARLGADVAAGLRSVAQGSSLPTQWERLAVCWQLAAAHGLSIATLMHTAQRDVVERERFSSRASAGMAGARTTAVMLAALPVVGIGLGQLIGAQPLVFLLSGGAGGWLLLVGVALACSGLLWSDHITGTLT